jgi:hypothetical protein
VVKYITFFCISAFNLYFISFRFGGGVYHSHLDPPLVESFHSSDMFGKTKQNVNNSRYSPSSLGIGAWLLVWKGCILVVLLTYSVGGDVQVLLQTQQLTLRNLWLFTKSPFGGDGWI